jgi:hypothetical protein
MPKPAKPKPRYFTWAHNVEGALRNGSFVRVWPDGRACQFMNGDYMGKVEKIPQRMAEVKYDVALSLIPACCGGKK